VFRLWVSVFYSHFTALGLNVTVEDANYHRRVDMLIDFVGHVYLFEFNVVDVSAQGNALAQILSKGYADQYRASGKPIHLVGVEFSRVKRQIVGFEVQTILPT